MEKSLNKEREKSVVTCITPSARFFAKEYIKDFNGVGALIRANGLIGIESTRKQTNSTSQRMLKKGIIVEMIKHNLINEYGDNESTKAFMNRLDERLNREVNVPLTDEEKVFCNKLIEIRNISQAFDIAFPDRRLKRKGDSYNRLMRRKKIVNYINEIVGKEDPLYCPITDQDRLIFEVEDMRIKLDRAMQLVRDAEIAKRKLREKIEQLGGTNEQ